MASLIPNSAEWWANPCPFCGAASGEPCRSVIQNWRKSEPGLVGKWLHMGRIAQFGSVGSHNTR